MKYIFSLLLIFGMMVAENTQISQANQAQYCEFSKIVSRKNLLNRHQGLYRYCQKLPCNKISLIALIAFQKLRDTYTDYIKIALKMRTLLFKEINFFTTRNLYWRPSNSREFSH